MDRHGPRLLRPAAMLLAAAFLVGFSAPALAGPAALQEEALHAGPAPLEVAQHEGTEPRELQPRYEHQDPPPRSNYNDEYIFGMTRGVAESTMHPAVKVLIFPLTVPLDFALLPFAAIGGFFG